MKTNWCHRVDIPHTKTGCFWRPRHPSWTTKNQIKPLLPPWVRRHLGTQEWVLSRHLLFLRTAILMVYGCPCSYINPIWTNVPPTPPTAGSAPSRSWSYSSFASSWLKAGISVSLSATPAPLFQILHQFPTDPPSASSVLFARNLPAKSLPRLLTT